MGGLGGDPRLPRSRGIAKYLRRGMVILDVDLICPGPGWFDCSARRGSRSSLGRGSARQLGARLDSGGTSRPSRSPPRSSSTTPRGPSGGSTPRTPATSTTPSGRGEPGRAARSLGARFAFHREDTRDRRAGDRSGGSSSARGRASWRTSSSMPPGRGPPRSTSWPGSAREFTVEIAPLRQEVHEVRLPQRLPAGGSRRPDPGRPGPGDVPPAGPEATSWSAGPSRRVTPSSGWTIPTPPTPTSLPALRGPGLARRTPASLDRGAQSASRGRGGVRRRRRLDAHLRPDRGARVLRGDGTSGNQFKNAPLVGEMMSVRYRRGRGGDDHDHGPPRAHRRPHRARHQPRAFLAPPGPLSPDATGTGDGLIHPSLAIVRMRVRILISGGSG